jgi:hypothetical protein
VIESARAAAEIVAGDSGVFGLIGGSVIAGLGYVFKKCFGRIKCVDRRILTLENKMLTVEDHMRLTREHHEKADTVLTEIKESVARIEGRIYERQRSGTREDRQHGDLP